MENAIYSPNLALHPHFVGMTLYVDHLLRSLEIFVLDLLVSGRKRPRHVVPIECDVKGESSF